MERLYSDKERDGQEDLRILCQMKQHSTPKHVIRLDPAGENQSLETRTQSVDWAPIQPVVFQFTSCEMPQQNNLVELAFPYLLGKARAMMGAAFIPLEIQGKVAIEAIWC